MLLCLQSSRDHITTILAANDAYVVDVMFANDTSCGLAGTMLVDGLGVDDWVHLQRPHPQADQAVDFYLPQAHNTSGLELIRVAMSDSEEELLESQTARMLR